MGEKTTGRYPQETVGTTLLCLEAAGEFRRVYVVERRGYTEVGEFTRGPLTQELYDAPAHYHAMHLSGGETGAYATFFGNGEPYLADFMDCCDSLGIAYGYLNITSDHHVTFRP